MVECLLVGHDTGVLDAGKKLPIFFRPGWAWSWDETASPKSYRVQLATLKTTETLAYQDTVLTLDKQRKWRTLPILILYSSFEKSNWLLF